MRCDIGPGLRDVYLFSRIRDGGGEGMRAGATKEKGSRLTCKRLEELSTFFFPLNKRERERENSGNHPTQPNTRFARQ